VLVLWLGCAAACPTARGQGLVDGQFNVDLSVGVAQGTSRAIGLGGAYAAVAEGGDGSDWNPASYAARPLWETDWFQWEITGDVFFPGGFRQNDYYNNGLGRNRGPQSSLSLGLGLRLQFDYIGTGFLGRGYRFDIRSSDGQDLSVHFVQANFGLGWGLLDGQILIGLAFRWASMDIELQRPGDANLTLVTFQGANVEVGAMVALEDRPWRLGLALRPAVRSVVPTDAEVQAVGVALPAAVYLPAEAQMGFAWQFGPRPFNARWVRPKAVKPRLRGEVARARCEREAEQVRVEMRAQGLSPPETMCPRLPHHARDPAFWDEERERREAEDEALDDAIDEAQAAVLAELDAHYRSLSRRYFLVSTELRLVAPVPNAIGPDAFLDQELRPKGGSTTVSFHLGVETEPWENRLKVRAGTYVEPGRNAGASPRPHGTFGFDVRLFDWDPLDTGSPWSFRAGMTFDGAPDYFNWGIGLGFWH